MSNVDFIKKYGKLEFRFMCKDIPRDLTYAKLNKKIGGYKVNNTKKYVKFYRNNKENVYLDFAMIFCIGVENLQKYIENMI